MAYTPQSHKRMIADLTAAKKQTNLKLFAITLQSKPSSTTARPYRFEDYLEIPGIIEFSGPVDLGHTVLQHS